MKRMIRKNLTNKLHTNFYFIISLIIIFLVIPIALFSITKMHSQINADIINHSRGSYDILVRPPSNVTEIEKELNIVPENYLGGGNGGISLSTWEQIKEREDIEVAAPISSLGYFTGLNSTLGILPSPEAPSTYHVEYTTSDGINEYVYNNYDLIFLGDPEISGSYIPLVTNEDMFFYLDWRHALFPLPVTYHHLVAIDPLEEEKLTTIDFTDIIFGEEKKGRAQGFGSSQEILDTVEIIPVLQLQDSGISVNMNIEIGELPFNEEDTKIFEEELGVDNRTTTFSSFFLEPEFEHFFHELLSNTEIHTTRSHIDLSPHLRPFNSEAKGFVVTENQELIDIDTYSSEVSYASGVSWNDITRYYLADPVPYTITEQGLMVQQVGEEAGVPTYRSIEEQGEGIREHWHSDTELSIMIDAVGFYEIGNKDESLASSPLGIYQLEPVRYINEAGESINMKPTVTAGSYVTAPAEGITNIESASFIKGDNPIDAIRVKIAGFNEYSPDAAKEIQRIATELEDLGLHVDIVAGSSLQVIDVEIEGVGTVQESWTTLGASGQIVGQWDVTNALLAITFIIVSIIYIVNRLKVWSKEKEADVHLLKILGWEHKDIKKLYLKEVFSIIVTAIMIAIWLLTSVIFYTEQSFQILFYQFIVILIALILLYLLINRHVNHLLQREKKQHPKLVKHTKSLLWRNISYYKQSIWATFVQILMVSSLASLVYLSLTESVAQTNLTLLGQHINASVSNWNQLIIICTFILALITIIENLSTMLQNRKKEIDTYKILGWKITSIKVLYTKEMALWTGIALLLGSILSFLLFFSFYPVTPQSSLFIFLTSLAFYLVILIIIFLILTIRLNQSTK
ncbi:hypothetical protein AJ85_08050 [Alkalihalobacillus alcalophilus ATCC 27647 = CGMCC 1.3604]|uniref:ABC3 transporter permease C-terminal domain-containing protein n=1 Tax=Alkalihalobacillus alcalophilus ATCC 27647 = CGMCC 1.3604 TaxID=1218173 RepID=A0A094WIC3_ALKAL|nr:ABC transporter permease [Alkalihalobacillus alcalophilus]KGA97539.1 hypothetical protein BALCAV_0209815 [Alkalihalobacillus alcalophilus ATCC 27647 = CGMCC 1.3604]MED1560794.1 ABC transporter permease [Alkalihalobacillus alcalophilus]THG90940.1 hypothetical protein AJ85_08050 [Alkalihalobacillus alcalophilus ATCC 27647 = CGMCC 1.3604]